MYSVGDKIEILFDVAGSQLKKGDTGTVINTGSGTGIHHLKMDSSHLNIWIHEKNFRFASSTSSPAQKIEVGDTVSGINITLGKYTGTIVDIDDITLGRPCTINVSVSANTSTNIRDSFYNLTLVHKAIAPTSTISQNVTISSGGAITAGLGNISIADYINEAYRHRSVPIIGKNIEHKHDWKFYMGLNERYEFCIGCNDKRDTDRRS